MLKQLFLFIILFFLILVVVELYLRIILPCLAKRFENVIIEENAFPQIDKNRISGFIEKGYDPHLGWVRKPNTSKEEVGFDKNTFYHINSHGYRNNLECEKFKKEAWCFGDSYTFCREVDDDETWEHYISKKLKINFKNFGVGNYGMDQAYLRFERELGNNNNKCGLIVIGVVPETIKRNLSVWKHYNEHGNVLAFKPRFILNGNNELVLIKNPIDKPEKFFRIDSIIDYVDKYDSFSKSFKDKIIKKPYFFYFLKNPRKIPFILSLNVAYFLELVGINWRKLNMIPSGKVKERIFYDILSSRINLYEKTGEAFNVTLGILKKFKKAAERKNIPIIFMIMPQKEDLDYIFKEKNIYYSSLLEESKKILFTLDPSFYMIRRDFSKMFPSKKYGKNYSVFGGHYNSVGNKTIADCLAKFIRERGVKIK